jgi:predicted nucleic acid-binding protein
VIVLDTNVISEAMRPAPDGHVLTWLDALRPDDTYTTAICASEILYGIARMPEGKRRRELEQVAARLFTERLRGRVLPFDHAAAPHFAAIANARRAAGTPISVQDAQIAAIARSMGAVVATRNTTDFHDTGVTVVNPWEAA